MIPVERHESLDVPGVVHGFFGREGGLSVGDFASLNVSVSVGDDPILVERNRAQVAEVLGFESLALAKQTHSNRVLVVSAPPPPGTEADAMVTDRPGLLLGIQTADCAPILLADPEAGVIGAAHAGWKGAASDIAEATVLAMVGLGADPARIRAVIGPAISAANYEVGPEFARTMIGLQPRAVARIGAPAGGREHFDLPGFLADQLSGAGIASVTDLGRCTYASPERYFSHRYATHRGTKTGRQISVIGLR